MKRAIVTGAGGFIGKALIKELVDNNIEVLAIVRNKHNLEQFIKYNQINTDLINIFEFDLKNIDLLEEVIRQEFPEKIWDVFYHLAWEGTSGDNRKNIDIQLKNIEISYKSMQLANNISCKKYIFAGSIMEKEINVLMKDLNKNINLSHIYSASKQYANNILQCLSSSLDLEYISPVITNTYGVGETSERFINSTLKKIILDDDLFFSSGKQIYDFVYISDLAKAFYLIGKSGKAGRNYVIGSGNAKPLKEFILSIKNKLSPEKDFIFSDAEYTGAKLSEKDFDITDLKEDTSYSPEVSFEEGISLTKRWLENNIDKF